MIQRPLRESDRDYVVRCVLFSFLSGSREAQRIHKDSYMRSHNDTVNGLLDHCSTIILCDEEDQDLIYGFLIFDHLPEIDVIHYVYMRKDFRGKGFIGDTIKSIKRKDRLALSHLTDSFKPARLKSIWSNVIYDSYLRSKY